MDAARALRETGYAVFPSLYPESFLARGRQAIARVYEGLGSPSLHSRGKSQLDDSFAILSGSGLMIGQLLSRTPELIDGYLDPHMLEVLHECLGAGFRVETTAGTISDQHRNEVLSWHNHVGGLDEDLERAIDLETLDPDRIRRLTLLIYLDGLSEQTGQLFVLPRTLADPLPCPVPEDEYRVDWPGVTVVNGPPGTAVLLEERTWHASLARRTPGYRRFVGAMLVAAWAPVADNVDPTVAAFADRLLARG